MQIVWCDCTAAGKNTGMASVCESSHVGWRIVPHTRTGRGAAPGMCGRECARAVGREQCTLGGQCVALHGGLGVAFAVGAFSRLVLCEGPWRPFAPPPSRSA